MMDGVFSSLLGKKNIVIGLKMRVSQKCFKEGSKKKFGTPGFLGLEGIDRKLEDVACRSGFS